MKARIGLLVLILALSASLSVAQSLGWWASPWAGSFRKASTAGLLEDDLDLMLDPARLPLIEGNRLYTNLSNLVSKNDDVFDNTSNGYYLLGGSGKIMDYGYAGLLYDRHLDRQYDTTISSGTVYVDNDANGTYDVKTQVNTTTYSGNQYKYTDWWIGYGRDLGPGKFGVLFYHSVNNEHDQPSCTDSKTTVTDVVTGAVTNETAAKTNISNQLNTSANGGALTYWYPFNDKIDLGLAGGIRINKAEVIDSIVYAQHSLDPSAPGTNGTTVDSTATSDHIPWDHIGMNLIGRVAGVYKWSDKVKTRTDIYFTTLVGGKKDDGFQKSTYHSLVAFQVPTGTQATDINRILNATVVQEDHNSTVGITSNTFVKFSDKVEMAIGLGLDSYNRDYTTTVNGTFNNTVTYNDGIATNQTAAYDLYQSTDNTIKQVQMHTEAGLAISTPVCVEFHITKPFVFRLGATHVFDYWNYTDNQTQEVTPLVTTSTDGYGVVTQTKPTPYVSANGASDYEKRAESYMNYTYGAGWEISKNLQIDLMGFAQLDNMANWKLSAIFKF